MKRAILIISAIAAIAIAATLFQDGWRNSNVDLPTIAITQIATHPALDEVRAGIISRLAENGYVEDSTANIIFRNANGDASLTLPIAEDFVRLEPDVIVPISTPSTLSVAQAVNSIPVVFSGVTDPVGTGIVTDLDRPGENITGVSDKWPFRAQVEAYLQYFAGTDEIGMIYTRGDDVSEIGVEAMTSLADELGFELRLQPVSQAADVYPAAVSLFREVDAVYTGIDHLLLESMDGLVKAANEANKPIFGGESGSVEKGAVLALSINMTQFGELTGDLVIKVLEGESVGNIPVHVVTTGDLVVNAAAAQQYGLNLEQLKTAGATIISGE